MNPGSWNWNNNINRWVIFFWLYILNMLNGGNNNNVSFIGLIIRVKNIFVYVTARTMLHAH